VHGLLLGGLLSNCGMFGKHIVNCSHPIWNRREHVFLIHARLEHNWHYNVGKSDIFQATEQPMVAFVLHKSFPF
jgi:hypothetical protein